jgi:hypothetical protein
MVERKDGMCSREWQHGNWRADTENKTREMQSGLIVDLQVHRNNQHLKNQKKTIGMKQQEQSVSK